MLVGRDRNAPADRRPDGTESPSAAGEGEAESLSKAERIRKYGEVFTPEWVVKKMCVSIVKNVFTRMCQ